jgi:hypothetical protein
MDFSQRRKVGFRGAFEFDNKRILLASEGQIKILAYFQHVDGSNLLEAIKTQRQTRSKSPIGSHHAGKQGTAKQSSDQILNTEQMSVKSSSKSNQKSRSAMRNEPSERKNGGS